MDEKYDTWTLRQEYVLFSFFGGLRSVLIKDIGARRYVSYAGQKRAFCHIYNNPDLNSYPIAFVNFHGIGNITHDNIEEILRCKPIFLESQATPEKRTLLDLLFSTL